MDDWSGRRVTQARAVVATWLPTPCPRCGREVTSQDSWVIGHRLSRAQYPELTWDPNNWRPEHKRCSDASAQSVVIEKARAEALAEHGIFPAQTAREESPHLPVSLHGPTSATESRSEPRADLLWHSEAHETSPWLADLFPVPTDAAVPLWCSPQHPDAVGSYGAQATEWIEQSQGIRLRWWQRYAIARQLEHREDGSLCWRTVLESAPRRSGKSVRIRGMALWRLAHAELIGEVQTVMHCGNDLPVCREVQRGAWVFAESVGWAVIRANGKEQIEADNGSRWLVRAQSGVYGYDAGLAVVDEGWDVQPTTVTEGLEPAMLERLWAQLHLTSTAHRRATSLMRGRLSAALSHDDGETLVMVWAAPPGGDPGDPVVWRSASPHWSPDRERMISAKHAAAMAGQADPDLDDPDPLAGFTSQYLNVWQLTEKREVRGHPIASLETWQPLVRELPDREPDGVGIEADFSGVISVARAYQHDEQIVVSVTEHQSLAEAAAGLRRATVGASLAADPALGDLAVVSSKERQLQAVLHLSRLMAEGTLRHDGRSVLTDQLLAVRTQRSASGTVLVSKGRADALKAVSWAIRECRKPTRGKPRILLPTS